MSQIVFLADYFAVIDSDDSSNNDASNNDSSDRTQPKLKFRIPEKDLNKENPFPEGIEHFALPNGWQILDQEQDHDSSP